MFYYDEVMKKIARINKNKKLGVFMRELNNRKNKSLSFKDELTDLLQILGKEESTYLDSFLSQMPFAIVLIDAFGKVIFCSDQIKSMFDLKANIKGERIKDVLPELQLDELLRRDERPPSHVIGHVKEKRILVTRSVITNNQENVIGAVAICEAFLNSVRTVERLIEVHDLGKVFNNLIGSAKTAYFITNEEGTCEYVNDAFLSLFNTERLDLLNKRYEPIDDLHKRAIERRRAIFNEPIQVTTSKGNKILTGQVAPLLINGKLRGSIGLYQDETPLSNVVEQLSYYKRLVRRLEGTQNFSDIVAQSEIMKQVMAQVKAVVNFDGAMIINGEVGTGKKLIAHALHHESNRKLSEVIHVSCSRYREEELKETLFGTKNSRGALDKAKTGTLILEEPTQIPLSVQQKIVTYCQENERSENQKIKIIALTTKDIAPLVFEKKFNQELFYYLNKIPIKIPPLRERQDDFCQLIEVIIEELNDRLRRNVQTVTRDYIDLLKQQHWAQNILSLRNFLEKRMLEEPLNKTVLSINDLGPVQNSVHFTKNMEEQVPLQELLDDYEKEVISKAYANNNFNKTKTAEVLQISLRSLYYKLEKLEIE